MIDEPTASLSERQIRPVGPIVGAAYRKHGRGKVIRMAMMKVLNDKHGCSVMNEEDAAA